VDVLDELAINVFTDGSSYSHPRRGGVGIRIITVGTDGHEIVHEEQPQGFQGATNQQMELQACIEALRYLTSRNSHVDPDDFSKVVIHTDSRYVVEGHRSALYTWSTTGWTTRDGNPVANAQQWKDLVRQILRVGRRVEFKWVKGHKSSAHNKAVDKIAKISAKGVLQPPLTVTSVRRKTTTKSVERGCVQLIGQRLTIRIITDEYLRVQRIYKYKYEVVSHASPFRSLVDIAFSKQLMRAGHTYYVLMGTDTAAPRIVKIYREVLK
jgi:ribonuclease HI